MGLELPKGKKAEATQAEVTQKTKAAVQAEANVTESVNNDKIGCDADKLIFVAPLGDPSIPDKTSVRQPGGAMKDIVTPTIVGYKFKASIDLDVPDVAPGDDLKNNLMSFTGDPMNTRHVKAGEEFILTKFETGMLISQERFNGRATGGDKPVTCTYITSSKKAANGGLVATNQATAIPGIALRALTEGVSIKDYKFEEVLSYTAIKGDNGVVRKSRTINPGYEKFAPLCAVKVKAPSVPTAAANVRNQNAEAFMRIAMSKRA